MLGWLAKLRGAAPELDHAVFAAARREVRLLDRLDQPQLIALRAQMARFLASREIVGVQGMEVSLPVRASVAALACLPLINLPFAWLGHWHELVLYPGEFRVRRQHQDDQSQIVTEWDDDLAGEAWDVGPVIVSWADIEQNLAQPHAGGNVLIHEIAHKIDMADGGADGVPPIHDRSARKRWCATMQSAYDELARIVDSGAEPPLDPYAIEGPDEFFATLSEYFFSAPALLAEAFPAAHAEFAWFYGGQGSPAPRPSAQAP